ncbi:actin maturation protease [Dromaius novaehollandiae]|uniref:actin maturation protease n=1 Tax=Dromaius novaehollandiae TaxID=8790 RepID=UPI00311FC372
MTGGCGAAGVCPEPGGGPGAASAPWRPGGPPGQESWEYWGPPWPGRVPPRRGPGAPVCAGGGPEPRVGPVPPSRRSPGPAEPLPPPSFSGHLKWLLFHRPVPSLIQEGPQCGLVALWMAAALLEPPREVSLEQIVQAARDRAFTAQGEMFSAAAMAALAQELFPCRAELLAGGLDGENRPRVLRHLAAGRPLLVPYDEDSNHEPCCRRGHKAHWAVVSGALLGLRSPALSPGCRKDAEIPGLFHAAPGPRLPPAEEVAEVFVLAQQGKSRRPQLWGYRRLHESNAQLTDFSPRRAGDGRVYVVPAGGVRAGLCGQAVLLHPPGPGAVPS